MKLQKKLLNCKKKEPQEPRRVDAEIHLSGTGVWNSDRMMSCM